jgi:hypothetical protein
MATFRYSIVRYVPDPVRGERVNVGVVVADRDHTYFGSRFLTRTNLGRLKGLGFADDFRFIGELASEIAESSTGRLPLDPLAGRWTLESVEKASVEWANSVQFSELRTATHANPETLVDTLFGRYVAAPKSRRQRARDKHWVRRKVTSGLRDAVSAAELDPDKIIHQVERVSGQFDEHTFDYVLANGKAQHLIETMSFETTNRRALRTEVDALAWTIDDVRGVDTEVPITVATIGKGKILDDAASLYERLDAKVVREDALDPWVAEVSQELIASLH